jgi:hypothetical protein
MDDADLLQRAGATVLVYRCDDPTCPASLKYVAHWVQKGQLGVAMQPGPTGGCGEALARFLADQIVHAAASGRDPAKARAALAAKRASGGAANSSAIPGGGGLSPIGAASHSSHSLAQRGTSLSRRAPRSEAMDMRKYARAFRRAEDMIPGQPERVTISQVLLGRFDNPDLCFTDGSKMSLNATNTRRLISAYGEDSDAWVGKEVELTRGETTYENEPKATIIVQPVSPRDPPTAPSNDEAPF